jgi:hypothetical protein
VNSAAFRLLTQRAVRSTASMDAWPLWQGQCQSEIDRLEELADRVPGNAIDPFAAAITVQPYR